MNRSLALRALDVRDLLAALWGAALPPAPDPWLTAVVDTVTADDEQGRSRGLIVTGDELPLHVLRTLIDDSPDRQAALQHLPPGLRRQLDDDFRWDASWRQLDERSGQTRHPDR